MNDHAPVAAVGSRSASPHLPSGTRVKDDGRSGVLGDALLAAATLYADGAALEIDGTVHTYASLFTSAAELAHVLRGMADPGARCAVLANRSLTGYRAFLACQFAGLIYLPLSQADPVGRQAATIRKARCNLLVADPHSTTKAHEIAARAGGTGTLLFPQGSETAELTAFAWTAMAGDASGDAAHSDALDAAGAPAYLIYTSGSTGERKGVVVRGESVLSYARAMTSLLGLAPDYRMTQLFDAGFDLSIHDMVVTWLAGACLVPFGRRLMFRAGLAVRDLDIHGWFSVPSSIAVLESTRQVRPDYLSGLRVSLFCGEALTVRDAKLWREASPMAALWNVYGPTEATIAVSAHRFVEDDEVQTIVPIGLPLSGARFVLLDPATSLPTRETSGELAIAGVQLSSGYWDDPSLTAERFVRIAGADDELVYRTGDRASCRDGLWHFLGRLDTEVKLGGGYRVNLLEIEALLGEATGCTAVACLIDGADGGPRLVATLMGQSEDPLSTQRTLRAHMPSYMLPKMIRWISTFPRLANGKIDRSAVKAEWLKVG